MQSMIFISLLLFCVGGTMALLNDLTPWCSHGDPLPNINCGRGTNRQDCPDGYSCHVQPWDAWAVCCKDGIRFKRSNEQLDALRSKLSNLQSLLKQIEKDEEKVMTTHPPTAQTETIDKAKETQMANSESKLSSNDIDILMTLKNILNRQKEKNLKTDSQVKEELENKETFYEKPMIEEGVDDVTVLKALASKLSKNKETSGSETAPLNQNDNLQDNKNPQPKEGKFSMFRQEVLAQIEDRLLQDMDFALKTGFTVEEILNDLQEKEKRFKELQLAEMENSIDRLGKLRD